MAESLFFDTALPKPDRYAALLAQIVALTDGEPNPVANTANTIAALRQALGYFWVGCYFVDGNELVLGPFQGPVACTRIARGRGVCGSAWAQNRTLVVPDVDAFPGHIACSSESKSEVVVPLRNGEGAVIGVLDVDSDRPNDFDAEDAAFLEKTAAIISQFYA